LAIVELDNVPSRQPRRGDPAIIVGLAGAIAVFALALWATAPQPVTSPAPVPAAAVPSAAPSVSGSTWVTTGPILISALSVTGDLVALSPDGGSAAVVSPSGVPSVVLHGVRTLVLPPWVNGVDMFEVPDRLTNENLIWTLRNVVHIRGGTGLASVEGPAVITWTENGFQYWMISPTRSTDELVELANGLK